MQSIDASYRIIAATVAQTGFQGVSHEDHKHMKLHRLYEDRPIGKSHYMMTRFAEINAGEPILGHFSGSTAVYTVEGT